MIKDEWNAINYNNCIARVLKILDRGEKIHFTKSRKKEDAKCMWSEVRKNGDIGQLQRTIIH